MDTRWDDVAKFTPRGIQTRDGTELEFDVIVCATGFDTTFRPRFPMIGRGNLDLADEWEQGPPKSYFGLAVPDMPNYFSMSLTSVSVLCNEFELTKPPQPLSVPALQFRMALWSKAFR